MPELPEVETLKRALTPLIVGKTFDRAVFTRPDLRFPIPTETLERELSEKLGAAVSIQTGRGGKGKLAIAFHSLDELDGILQRLRG